MKLVVLIALGFAITWLAFASAGATDPHADPYGTAPPSNCGSAQQAGNPDCP